MGGVIPEGEVVIMGLVMPVALQPALIVIQAVNLVGVGIVVAVAVILALVLAVTAMVVVAMGMAISMAVAASCGVSAGLRQEGGLAALHGQPPLLQQIGQHRIFKEPQLAGAHLQCHMAVAEVIGRPQQVEGVAGAHHQQGFGGSLHPHRRIARRATEPFARLQRHAALQLQHQITAAGATAMAAKPGAVIGREGQPQRRLLGAGRRRAGAPGDGEGPGCGFRQGGWLPKA